MRRRDLIRILGGAALAWPAALFAQQRPRIGVLVNGAESETEVASYLEAFLQALRAAGWIEDQRLLVDVRWNNGSAVQARALAAELASSAPDALFAASSTNLAALMRETRTIPIVFVQVSDPVVQGFVTSLTRPGGNVTGFGAYEFSIGGKWVDLLRQMSPSLARVGVLFNPETSPQTRYFMRAIERAAAAFDMKAVALPVREDAQIESVIADFAREPRGGLVLPTDSFTRLREKRIADLALRHGLPTISASPDFARTGGLMFYGVGNSEDYREMWRQGARYIDRILKGAKPSDLPVQLPIKYHLAINLKIAKGFGIEVPVGLLLIADEQIE